MRTEEQKLKEVERQRDEAEVQTVLERDRREDATERAAKAEAKLAGANAVLRKIANNASASAEELQQIASEALGADPDPLGNSGEEAGLNALGEIAARVGRIRVYLDPEVGSLEVDAASALRDADEAAEFFDTVRTALRGSGNSGGVEEELHNALREEAEKLRAIQDSPELSTLARQLARATADRLFAVAERSAPTQPPSPQEEMLLGNVARGEHPDELTEVDEKELAERRKNPAFRARLERSIEENRELLERLGCPPSPQAEAREGVGWPIVTVVLASPRSSSRFQKAFIGEEPGSAYTDNPDLYRICRYVPSPDPQGDAVEVLAKRLWDERPGLPSPESTWGQKHWPGFLEGARNHLAAITPLLDKEDSE